jgi:hypothetical protein
MRGVPLGLRDRVAVDIRHSLVAALLETRVPLDTEEDKRGKDKQHQHELHDPLVRADKFEHSNDLICQPCASSAQRQTGEPQFA